MERLELTTPNFTDENIQKLSELFPNCVTEDSNGKAIDFDALKQELSSNIIEGSKERYQLTWPGKAQSLVTANTPINKTLRPNREESKDFDNTENLYIEGDNLEVLKLLQETYLGKIKMIYIDPPYNTGKDFVYKDNFTQDRAEYDEESGNVDDEGGRLVSNPDSSGRYHSDWLSMMNPRLKLARNLLKDNGIIFMSIDDNEMHNLRKLCDEVFGGENFVGNISVENNPKGRKNSDFVSVSSEYLMIYAKSKVKSCFVENIPKKASDMTQDADGKYVHNSGKRILVGNNNFNARISSTKSNKHYSVYFNGQEIKIIKENLINDRDDSLLLNGYKRYVSQKNDYYLENTYTKEKLLELFQKKALDFKEDKIFEKNFNSTVRIKSILTNRDYDAIINNNKRKFKVDVKTTSSNILLKKIFNTEELVFPASKNIGLIGILLTLFNESDFTVLDFFSGSSATAHAVIQLNAEDSGKRKFIMAQIPEATDEKSEAHKAGYKTIAEIGKERIRRAGEKIKNDNADKEGIDDLDVGFRVLKVDSSNMKDVYFSPDNTSQDDMFDLASNIKDDRTDEDLLFMVLLDWGIDLSVKIERSEVAGKTVYFVDDNFLAACFEENLDEDFVKALVTENPLKVVLRDSGFASSSVKINVEQIFKQADIEVKVI